MCKNRKDPNRSKVINNLDFDILGFKIYALRKYLSRSKDLDDLDINFGCDHGHSNGLLGDVKTNVSEVNYPVQFSSEFG